MTSIGRRGKLKWSQEPGKQYYVREAGQVSDVWERWRLRHTQADFKR